VDDQALVKFAVLIPLNAGASRARLIESWLGAGFEGPAPGTLSTCMARPFRFMLLRYADLRCDRKWMDGPGFFYQRGES